MSKRKRCRRCGKRWCGTNRRLNELYPDLAPFLYEVTYGSKKCRNKGPKR